MKYITNSFSLGMLELVMSPYDINVRSVTTKEAAVLGTDATSIVGHADTADLFTKALGYKVPFNRASVACTRGDILIVGQYRGPRLPEGTKVLPEGARIDWVVVTIQ